MQWKEKDGEKKKGPGVARRMSDLFGVGLEI